MPRVFRGGPLDIGGGGGKGCAKKNGYDYVKVIMGGPLYILGRG